MSKSQEAEALQKNVKELEKKNAELQESLKAKDQEVLNKVKFIQEQVAIISDLK